MNCRRLIAACSMGFLLSMALPSVAQSPGKGGERDGSGKYRQKSDAPATPRSGGSDQADPGVLAGPTVEPEAQEGRNNPMNAPNNAGRGRAGNGQAVPLRRWMEVIRGLDLSSEQTQQIATITSDFQAAQRDFRADHGEEMRRLQQQLRAAREAGEDVDPSVREQFQTLEAAMPRQVESQQLIWDVLTLEQQEVAREALAEIEKRNARERQRGGAMNDSNPAMTGAPPASSAPPAGNSGRPAGQRNVDRPNQGGAGEALTPSGSGGRNERRSTTTDNDPMPGAGGMSDTPTGEPARAAPMHERAIERRRKAGNAIRLDELDAQARSRVEFLLAHLSASRAGNAPTVGEKSFRFTEEEGS